MPEGALKGPEVPRLGGEEAMAACPGPTERLAEHVARGQLPRLDHHVSGVCRDAVSAARATTLPRLRVIVRLGLGESHCPFAEHEPDGQCSKFHWSPFSLEMCPATIIY